MSTIIIADSRGRDIQQHLDKLIPGKETWVLVHRGAGYELAVIKSLRSITSSKPKAIIIMAGICDITWRDKKTKKTKLRYNTTEECVKHVMGAARAAQGILDAVGSFKISFATVTGLNLADYNHSPRKYMSELEYDRYASTKTIDTQQTKLNDAVIEINRQLTALNKKNGVPSTWTSTVIHSYYRKVHHHNYKKLEDGCHPDGETRGRWAKQLAKSIRRIFKE